jgi:hypothetical protein
VLWHDPCNETKPGSIALSGFFLFPERSEMYSGYTVFCFDDGELVRATRRVWKHEREAEEYAETVSPSRNPEVRFICEDSTFVGFDNESKPVYKETALINVEKERASYSQFPTAAPKNKEEPHLAICGGKGFQLFFRNGWGISVQFGPGNYCEHHWEYDFNAPQKAQRWTSEKAELALWDAHHNWVFEFFTGDQVLGYVKTDHIAEFITAAKEGSYSLVARLLEVVDADGERDVSSDNEGETEETAGEAADRIVRMIHPGAGEEN